MRLINTKTLKLEKFSEKDLPPYAILSHTWGKDTEELSFRNFQSGRIDKSSLGWIKLEGSCRQAEKDRLSYAWIDTCCIDKSDAAELGEAINSMFRWYRQAAVCYVYLTDVPANEDPSSHGSRFRKSRWFTRGWTLQELLAPQTLRFYNADWQCIGNKAKMCSIIMDITGVPRSFLLGLTDLHQASVAQRMSWAARRQTKEAEDLAYCLLGIFDVMMPMLYGEGGPKAFFRLQDRIMKTIADDSLFAWGFGSGSPHYGNHVTGGRVLASSPSDFANSGDIVPRQHTKVLSAPDFSSGRLQINLPLIKLDTHQMMGLLNCGPITDKSSVVGIYFIKPDHAGSEVFVRPNGGHASLTSIPRRQAPCTVIHVVNK